MPINLLKFPNDLLREVFRLCDPFALYKLSKCSEKCSQKSITLGGAKKWKIRYRGGNEISVLVDDSRYYFNQTDNPKNYFQMTLWGKHNYMDIEFPNGGGADLFIYLIDTFGIRIVEMLEVTFCKIAIVFKLAKDLVDRNMEIEKFEIGNVREVQDFVSFMPLMIEMNISQEFKCSVMFPPDFHFEFVNYPRNIFIYNSSWFTIGQLLDCTCVRIELANSSFNNHDLNVFLQKWKKDGSFPNLRCLRIQSEFIDNQSPIQEMIPPIRTVNNPMTKVSIRNSSYPEIVNAVRLTKDDNTEGWLKVDVWDWSVVHFLVADPADTVMEEIRQ